MSVAITGLGVVSSLGCEPASLFEALLAGESGARRIEDFALLGLDRVVAAPVDREAVMARLRAEERALAWPAQMAIVAARAALRDAGLAPELGDAMLSAGCSIGSPGVVERDGRAWTGVDLADPQALARYAQGSVVAAVAHALGARGEVQCWTTTCAAGNYALGSAREALLEGKAPFALAGGVEELSTLPFVAFHQLRALADVCRPFDEQRAGLLFGEGAAFLVLEPAERARARGARVYAELASVGFSNDAHHLVAPDDQGRGAALAMRRALAGAGIEAREVGYVNAHGTGTALNDAAESAALVATLGSRVPVSSTKGGTGHCMAAASAIEALITTLAIARGVLPPTVGLNKRAPEVEADVIAGAPRTERVDVALSSGFGFGGNNAVAVLSRAARGVTAVAPRDVWITGGAAIWGDRVGVDAFGALLGREGSPGALPFGARAGDLGEILGKKGLRHVDRGALLWAAAIEHDLALWLGEGGEQVGVAAGSAYPAYGGVVALMREFLAGAAKKVNPGLVPFATSNCAPSWLALRHAIRGYNASLGSGACAGLDAIRAAAQQIRRGTIERAVAGGVEGWSGELWRARGSERLVEGAAAVALSASPEGAWARLVAEAGAFDAADPQAALRRAVATALGRSSEHEGELALVPTPVALPADRVQPLEPILGDGFGAMGGAVVLAAALAARARQASCIVAAAADPAGYASAVVVAPPHQH